MRTLMKATMAAAFLAALALATGCEDTPLFAGKDFKMTLVAENQDAVTWDVVATVVNDANEPQPGITVAFSSSSGGTLLHGSSGVSTHSDGRAIDVLTVQEGAPASITVTATSAALTKTVTITTSAGGVCNINSPPDAAILPSGTQTLPDGVMGASHDLVLDGTTSFDLQTPSENLHYLWDCQGSNSLKTTPTATCTYTNGSVEGHFTVTLTVTDDGLVDHESECALTDSASIDVIVPKATNAP
jgi:hypothetical protein